MAWKQPIVAFWEKKKTCAAHPPHCTFLCLFLCFYPLFLLSSPFFSSTTSLEWPQGAVSCLDAGTLLWAFIDFPSAPHSQSGQSAWGPRCLVTTWSTCTETQKRNGEEDWEETLKTETAFIKGCPSFQRPAVISVFSLPRFCRLAPRSSHCQRRSMVYSTRLHSSCFKIVLLCFFSAGEDPFTDPQLLNILRKLTLISLSSRFSQKDEKFKALTIHLLKIQSSRRVTPPFFKRGHRIN